MSDRHHTLDLELGDVIAVGNFGVVYRARNLQLNHDVALKVPHPKHGTERWAAERLLREAQLTAQLQHPGIPSAHAFDLLPDGRPFFAMKLIKGKTLAEIVEQHLPSVNQFLAMFESVCQAVGYAHHRGVIHCDLEPSNVMIGAFGEVIVLDWGSAKVLSGSSVHTREPCAGDWGGAPAFLSPELARGDRRAVNERSDVFGLGALLLFLLTGQAPYTGADDTEVLRKAAAADLSATLRRLDKCGVGSELQSLCCQCLSENPADRPADATVVASEVSQIRKR